MSALLLYATETGTSQDVADRIALSLRRIHLPTRLSNIATFPLPSLISESLIIFVVSTTGSGLPPRSMVPFWNMLMRSDLPEDLFEDVRYACFGLGDTMYERFCWPAKKLCRRMDALGADELCERGEGDEQHPLGIDGGLEPWIENLLAALLKIYPLSEGLEVLPADALPPPRVTLLGAPSENGHLDENPTRVDSTSDNSLMDNNPTAVYTASGKSANANSIQGDSSTRYYDATLRCNRRITAAAWTQDVRHLEWEFDENIQYDPGDVAVIHPVASPLIVESFLTTLGWANYADDPITIQHRHLDQSIPTSPGTTTLRALLTHTVDIAAVPRRSFFQLLRHFVEDKMEEERLGEFLSQEGVDELYEYAQRPRRTICEVLSEFRSARIPRDYIFDVFPPLRPRQFSIASSIKRHPREVHLCVAIVKYRTMLKVPRVGVCTSYLASLEPGTKIRIGIQKGILSLPPDPKTPIICVGPGTGIAPMRAVIEARVDAGATDTTLYFGCRSSTKDQHYASEWESYVSRGDLVYRLACSRDGKDGERRTYVQDLMKGREWVSGDQGDSAEVWRVLERGGWVFISGSSNKMPAGVKDALADCISRHGGRTLEEAKEYVRRMEREGRIVEECWS